jgi:hypothetical protein
MLKDLKKARMAEKTTQVKIGKSNKRSDEMYHNYKLINI